VEPNLHPPIQFSTIDPQARTIFAKREVLDGAWVEESRPRCSVVVVVVVVVVVAAAAAAVVVVAVADVIPSHCVVKEDMERSYQPGERVVSYKRA
jgi:hypothetical protein